MLTGRWLNALKKGSAIRNTLLITIWLLLGIGFPDLDDNCSGDRGTHCELDRRVS